MTLSTSLQSTNLTVSSIYFILPSLLSLNHNPTFTLYFYGLPIPPAPRPVNRVDSIRDPSCYASFRKGQFLNHLIILPLDQSSPDLLICPHNIPGQRLFHLSHNLLILLQIECAGHKPQYSQFLPYTRRIPLTPLAGILGQINTIRILIPASTRQIDHMS